ncbi:MAG TPA: hypothetical protein VNQ78_18430 [Paracoccus sp. (in: a-proteobacteria)]|nr:hypothetical protein [Paracoccus sp. (in: a-proteobacteria)]HWL58635.1 hypothetical protein [Paracoccus sp. (in: a-proteobacteria)]
MRLRLFGVFSVTPQTQESDWAYIANIYASVPGLDVMLGLSTS